jgi:hypothetical protein
MSFNGLVTANSIKRLGEKFDPLLAVEACRSRSEIRLDVILGAHNDPSTEMLKLIVLIHDRFGAIACFLE